METSERLDGNNWKQNGCFVSNCFHCLFLKAKGLIRGVLWKLELFKAGQFAEQTSHREL